jgi:hypothetical protein
MGAKNGSTTGFVTAVWSAVRNRRGPAGFGMTITSGMREFGETDADGENVDCITSLTSLKLASDVKCTITVDACTPAEYPEFAMPSALTTWGDDRGRWFRLGRFLEMCRFPYCCSARSLRNRSRRTFTLSSMNTNDICGCAPGLDPSEDPTGDLTAGTASMTPGGGTPSMPRPIGGAMVRCVAVVGETSVVSGMPSPAWLTSRPHAVRYELRWCANDPFELACKVTFLPLRVSANAVSSSSVGSLAIFIAFELELLDPSPSTTSDGFTAEGLPRSSTREKSHARPTLKSWGC